MSNDFPLSHFFKKTNENNNLVSSAPIEPQNIQKKELSTKYSDEEIYSISKEIHRIIQNYIPEHKYKAFIKNNLNINYLDDKEIKFIVPSEFIKKMIKEHYFSNLQSSIDEMFGKKYEMSINVTNINKTPAASVQHAPLKQEQTSDISNFASDILNELNKKHINTAQVDNKPSFKLNEQNPAKTAPIEPVHYQTSIFGNVDYDKTFDNFIVGPSNNMAHAFSLAVSKNPGQIYPQLYLYGDSGLGKTHLLHAVCNQISKIHSDKVICFITANDFTKEMVSAIQGKTIDQFKIKYTQDIDVLIIDDIHELSGRNRTQAEFFSIFNSLNSNNKQLIFTSDKAPKEIQGIEDRIITRLSSALLIDIKQPDLETRIAILKRKALEKDIFINDEVINLIASCVKSNVRELEGKLIRLGAYSDLMNVDIDIEIAKEQLGLDNDSNAPILTIETITKAVSKYFKISMGDIRGKARKAHLVQARHIAMYMSHKNLKKTLEEIGDYFDKRDHSTVIHAIDKIKGKIKDDSQLSQKIYEIESSF